MVFPISEFGVSSRMANDVSVNEVNNEESARVNDNEDDSVFNGDALPPAANGDDGGSLSDSKKKEIMDEVRRLLLDVNMDYSFLVSESKQQEFLWEAHRLVIDLIMEYSSLVEDLKAKMDVMESVDAKLVHLETLMRQL